MNYFHVSIRINYFFIVVFKYLRFFEIKYFCVIKLYYQLGVIALHLRTESLDDEPNQKKVSSAKRSTKSVEVNLDVIRRSRGISQKDLADKLNLSQPAISNIETCGNCRLDTLKKFADGVGGKLEIKIKFPDGVSYKLSSRR